MIKIVLFVCEGNIFRSQMAEAFFNASARNGWNAESAGTRPGTSVHPSAVRLMHEVGIDISSQRPKPFDTAVAAGAWRVIAMCNLDGCPAEIIQRTERWPIIDPAALPKESWHQIRDEIGRRVNALLAEI